MMDGRRSAGRDRFRPGLVAAFLMLLAGQLHAIDMKDAEAAVAAGDYKYAMVIARDLAKTGNGEAALFLAKAYLNGTGVEGDLNEAIKWFFRADVKQVKEAGETLSLLRRKVFEAPAGDAVAGAIRAALEDYRTRGLATEYSDLTEGGDGDSVGARLFKAGRKEEAVEVLLREAKALDPAASIYLKIFYFNTVEGVPERDPRILAHFQMLAEEGDPASREILGRILIEGAGMARNEEKAIEMLTEATSEESRKMLAAAYLERGWEEKAAGVYRKAGAEGSAWGNFEYSKLLLRDGLHSDAVKYLERTLAAEPENWAAAIKLGKTLIEGRGFSPDKKRGFALYCYAADEGNDPISQYVVGLLYLRGVGVPASKEDAVRYFAKASAQGVAQAQKELDKLTAARSPTVVANDSDVPMELEKAKAPKPTARIPSKAAKPKPARRPKVHVVREGDTFYGITLKYGISYLALRRANPGVNEAKLKLGQRIRLPAK